ncbi:MAG TPA: apolipoprotein N-acyltransferase [Pirellulaceae bacterium]|nr:apolipoprotein N-acyltransferase [Pirellulaceae bacterium]
MLWAAFPPLRWTWLAWLAPLFWLFLIQTNKLVGRRPYLAMWLASSLHWLAMLQGVRLAHPLNSIGWIALSLYLAAYLPCFVALSRIAVHRWRISVLLAAPIVWTGLELLRSRLLTGFSFGLLAHTQVEWTHLIQISDLFGAYGVSFVVMLVAACAIRTLPINNGPRAVWPLIPLVVVLAGTLGYGYLRLVTAPPEHAANITEGIPQSSPARTPLKVALIQRAIDTKFESDPQRNLDTFHQYWEATLQARQENPDLDLIIWPESVFSANNPEMQCEPDFLLPGDVLVSREEFLSRFKERSDAFDNKLQSAATAINQRWRDGALETLDIHLLVGTETICFGTERMRVHNTALLIDPTGEIVDRYYKMHPVMFGEYIPFGSWLPLIYEIAPMSQGITPGDRPQAFQLAGSALAPSICFESSVPHLIRRQVVELSRQGESPDILVNITHDGWFFGSSIVDLQFAGTVFRAVELRRPILVAANAGISCWIDGTGTVQARGPRHGNDVIIANVRPDGRSSGYELWGDLPVAVCLVVCFLLFATGVRVRLASRAIPEAAGE